MSRRFTQERLVRAVERALRGGSRGVRKLLARADTSRIANLVRYRDPAIDLALVVNDDDRAWILHRICLELHAHVTGTTRLLDYRRPLRNARALFFSHYALYLHALAAQPDIVRRRCIVLYTHRKDVGVSDDALVKTLNQCARVLFMTQSDLDDLVARGLSPVIGQHVVFGADEDVFIHGPARGRGDRPVIGFCLGFRAHPHYRERKNYSFVVELIKHLAPKYRVVLVGQGFRDYERFPELRALPSFEYVEPPFEEYCTQYQRMDVFVSASTLEGGPVPLIEAMMCGVVPVVSRTGFAPTVVQHGSNGFIFDLPCDVGEVEALIEEALTLTVDTRQTALQYTWRRFAQRVEAAAAAAT